jgi:3-phosphoshikimate 1-carboxyvinyltransferase
MRVEGRVRVPGDKSISHRALIVAALATGRSSVRRILRSADVESTAGVLRALGCAIPPLDDRMGIQGSGIRGFRAPDRDLDCGNSGTTVRLMSGAVAGHSFASRFVGDASLSRRPMRRVAEPLTAMGASVEFEGSDGLPITVRGGTLEPLEWTSKVPSAQVKSALLLAGLVSGVKVTVRETERSRDHTERMLAAVGVKMSIGGKGAAYAATLHPAKSLSPLDIDVPADPSSAAFFAALAALSKGGELQMSSVLRNDTRWGFFETLRRMGAKVGESSADIRAGEPVVGELRVAPGKLVGIQVTAEQIPSMIDELPILACLAACAEGETIVNGAAELRVKESDRIAAVVSNLVALGATAEELPDGFRIVGSDRPLKGRVTTRGDHRIAMAFGVLGALPRNQIEIDDRDCVGVSYPGFWAELAKVVRR